MHIHTHWQSVCNFKAKICLAPVLIWHSIWQSIKSLLHPLVAPRLQKKQTTTVGIIKVYMGVCASYLQHSAFCSLRIFMAVRYAENLTLFKSATGRDRDREMKSRQTKRKPMQKIRKQSATEICLLGNISRTSVFNEKRLFVSDCLRRWLRGGVANADCVIRLSSSVSVGASAICWAAGLKQTFPKFHSLLLIWLLIKEQSYWPPHRDRDMHMDIKLQERERKDQDAISKLNVKSKLTAGQFATWDYFPSC